MMLVVAFVPLGGVCATTWNTKADAVFEIITQSFPFLSTNKSSA